jgi:hypothetical protein
VDEVRVDERLEPGQVRAASMAWGASGEGDKVLYVTVEAVHPRDPSPANNEYKCVVRLTRPPPENRPPVIDSFTASKYEVKPNETVVLTAMAFDPESDPLSYTYSSSGGSLEGQGESARWTAPPEPGTHTISVSVADGHGHSAHSSLDMTVKGPPAPPLPPAPENAPPRIVSFKYEPAEPLNDGKTFLKLAVEAADADGAADLQKAQFNLQELDGPSAVEVVDRSGGMFVLDYPIPTGVEPGARSVTVTVYDKAGASARRTMDIGIGVPTKQPAGGSGGGNIPGPDVLLVLCTLALLALFKRPRR